MSRTYVSSNLFDLHYVICFLCFSCVLLYFKIQSLTNPYNKHIPTKKCDELAVWPVRANEFSTENNIWLQIFKSLILLEF